MADSERKPHIQARLKTETEPFSPKRKVIPRQLPSKDPKSHSEKLISELESVFEHYKAVRTRTPTTDNQDFYITVVLEAQNLQDISDTITLLDKPKQGLTLMNLLVQPEGQRTDDEGSDSPPPTSTSSNSPIASPGKKSKPQRFSATIAVNSEGKTFIEKDLEKYGHQLTRKGKPKKGTLYNKVEHITSTAIEQLYTDPKPLPDKNQSIWWELWLKETTELELKVFDELLRELQIPKDDKTHRVASHKVIVCYTHLNALQQVVDNSTCIAEIRQMPHFDLVELSTQLQDLTIANLAGRISHSNPHEVYVLILDYLVDAENPLLSSHIKHEHRYVFDKRRRETVQASTMLLNSHSHATAMAGLSLYGDLKPLLSSTAPIVINHGLESAAISPSLLSRVEIDTFPNWPGEITEQVLKHARNINSQAKRIVCSAITDKSGMNTQGQPDSWSTHLDQLAYGIAITEEATLPKQLFIISAGNITGPNPLSYDLTASEEQGIHSPGQAWNILTVGAYTTKTETSQEVYKAIAPKGGLNPTSTTSRRWPNQGPIPIKPDIVCEGGNLATDGVTAGFDDALLPLTTDARNNRFAGFGQTSAASAIAARAAAIIQHKYPNVRPETIRALMVHAAHWTEEMKKIPNPGQRLRTFGYGVPQLNHSLFSSSNDVTIIIEEELTPFTRYKGSNSTNEVKYIHLPWPKDLLTPFRESNIELRITLSYFIEPNPRVIGIHPKYAYQSHLLNFLVRQPSESQLQFKKRINAANQDNSENTIVRRSKKHRWEFGPKSKHTKSSIFSNWWSGPVAELLDMDTVAIFPQAGWWKSRKDKHNQTAPFSLVVSLRAPTISADIYNAITNTISTMTQVQTEIDILGT